MPEQPKWIEENEQVLRSMRVQEMCTTMGDFPTNFDFNVRYIVESGNGPYFAEQAFSDRYGFLINYILHYGVGGKIKVDIASLPERDEVVLFGNLAQHSRLVADRAVGTFKIEISDEQKAELPQLQQRAQAAALAM